MPGPTEHLDVLVVGAGPAGCAAGIVAARAGLRVCVVDRATFPRPKTCGDAVSNEGAKIVDDLGRTRNALRTVPHAIVRAAEAILPNGERLRRDFGSSPGYIVPRYHLDNLLFGFLTDQVSDVRQGLRVSRLLTDADGRVRGAETSDGHRLRALVTIAADGPGSVAWKAVGEDYRRKSHLAVAITGYYEGVDFAGADGVSEHYFESDLKCGYGWAFPGVEGAVNVGVYQRSDRLAEHGHKLPALLRDFLARHPDRFSGATPAAKPKTWALPIATTPRPPVAPGLLTAGDAGYFVDPLSGEGIWQALRTGQLAGEAAARALSRGGLGLMAARRYQVACAREIGLSSLVRLGIQEGVSRAVTSGAYRRPAVRSALRWGYEGSTFEMSKRIH